MKIIGIGAAGNKAVWSAVEGGSLEANEVLLMNSTFKDFPNETTDRCVLISNIGGCGKEREVGTEIMNTYLSDQARVNKLFNEFIKNEGEHIIIVTSTGGGTGSGASIPLAKYCYEQFKADVTIIGFKGFGDDLRELNNTLGFLKDIPREVTVQLIDNNAFGDVKLEAQRLANTEVARRILILSGELFVSSHQNIDSTDLYKLVTTPGYQQVETTYLTKIKNSDDINTALKRMIDNSKGVPTSPSVKSLGVIYNIDPELSQYIDLGHSFLKEKYGASIEVFTHVQHPEQSNDEKNWVGVIASGAKMPIKELKDIYTQYLEMEQKLDTTDDEFFNTSSKIELGNLGTRARRGRKQQQTPVSNGTFTPNTTEATQDQF